MSHRSEVWDTSLLCGQNWSAMVVPGAPIVSCLKAFFGSYPQMPVGKIYRPQTLAHQRVGLDYVVGKKIGPSYRCGARWLTGKKETFIDGSFVAEKPKAAKVPNWWWWQTVRGFLSEATFVQPHLRKWPWSRPHWLDSSQRRRSCLWLRTKPMTVSL